MIKTIVFFFIDIWLLCKYLVYRLFVSKKDYEIYNIDVEYTLESEDKPVYNSLFWITESRNWDGKETQRLKASTTDIRDITPVPSSIKDVVLFITYKYNNDIFTYVTKDLTVTEVPRVSKEMSFNIPIDSVFADGKDITGTYLSYAGPKRDFHNEDIECKFLFDYSSLVVKDAVGQVIDIVPDNSMVKNLP